MHSIYGHIISHTFPIWTYHITLSPCFQEPPWGTSHERKYLEEPTFHQNNGADYTAASAAGMEARTFRRVWRTHRQALPAHPLPVPSSPPMATTCPPCRKQISKKAESLRLREGGSPEALKRGATMLIEVGRADTEVDSADEGEEGGGEERETAGSFLQAFPPEQYAHAQEFFDFEAVTNDQGSPCGIVCGTG